MGLVLVDAAEDYPVTLAEAKAHLRYLDDDQDGNITIYLAAAVAHAEKFLGRALALQAWDYFADAFPDGAIELPMPPLVELIGVFYNDSAGVEQEMSAALYTLDASSSPARITLVESGSWPTTIGNANAVRVRFRAGYVSGDSPYTDAVPFNIKAAILLIIGSLFAHREDVVVGQTTANLPRAAEDLLRPDRVSLGMA